MATDIAFALGVLALLGRRVPVVAFSWFAVRAGVATLPLGVRWQHVWGVGILCGIGFTMSLFISNLAFEAPELLDAAQIGVLIGSLIAGMCGAALLAPAAGRTQAATARTIAE